MRRVSFFIGVLLLLSACASAGTGTGKTAPGQSTGRPIVVTSTSVLADLIRNVTGDRADVISLVPAGGNPYEFEPAPQDSIVLTKATVFFANGLFYEAFSRKLLEESAPSLRVVTLSEGQKVRESTIDHDDHGHLFPALGVALIAVVRFGPVDVASYLFGNVLAISITDLLILAIAVLVLGVLLLGLYHDLTFAAFDEESAAAAGVPIRFLAYLFLVMVAITVVVSLQTVGLILVTSLLVISAAAARQWVDRLAPIMWLAAAFGLTSALVGLYASYHLRLPSGATIVLTIVSIFVGSWILRGIRDRRGRQLNTEVTL